MEITFALITVAPICSCLSVTLNPVSPPRRRPRHLPCAARLQWHSSLLCAPCGEYLAQARPRVWWCPTVPLTFLPIHADDRKKRPRQSVIHIPSYAPTLRPLHMARTHSCGNTRPVGCVPRRHTAGPCRQPRCGAIVPVAQVDQGLPGEAGQGGGVLGAQVQVAASQGMAGTPPDPDPPAVPAPAAGTPAGPGPPAAPAATAGRAAAGCR